jgi:hypothetical protein
LGVAVRNNIADAGKSLTTAPDEAEKSRHPLRGDIDPIEHAKARREAERRKAEATKLVQQAERQTLARCRRAYHERVIEPQRSTKHSADWINSLEPISKLLSAKH